MNIYVPLLTLASLNFRASGARGLTLRPSNCGCMSPHRQGRGLLQGVQLKGFYFINNQQQVSILQTSYPAHGRLSVCVCVCKASRIRRVTTEIQKRGC